MAKKKKKLKGAMKRFKDFDYHMRLYILLNSVVFTGIGLSSLDLILKKEMIIVGSVELPVIFSLLVFGVSFFMVLMGFYYYKAHLTK